MAETDTEDFRCGRVALIGRPNVGKSTLLNRLVGAKLSITSKKAQTTRQHLSGIVTTSTAQLIFVDTPGFQTAHRSRLNERMNRTVRQSLAAVDAIVVLADAGRTLAADRAVIALLPACAQAVVALNKIDLLADRAILLPQMAALAALYPFAALVPLSAERGSGVAELCAAVAPLLPRAPAAFPAEALTDRDERFFAAEFIREKIFRLLGDELPYASA
ncbi:MAG TPA: GTPase Era, partial [Paraburkholderia sp.]